MFFQLGNMSSDGAPSSDLSQVIHAAAAGVVSAIPLEPSARIFIANPVLFPPNRERLRGFDSVIIQAGIVPSRGELCFLEPTGGKLFPAISHVFSTKYSEL